MTLSCYELQSPLEINEGKIITLILENPVFYRNFINDLILQSNNMSDRFTLSDNSSDALDFPKNTDIISDIFSLSFDSRQISNKVNQLINEELNISEIDTAKLISQINEIAAVLSSRLDFEAIYNPISDLNGVLKLFGFYIESENLPFVEKLTEYLSFLSKYLNKKLFILVNLKSALSEREFAEFVKTVNYKKIGVLLIENKKVSFTSDNEKIRIVDSDLCEI